MKIALSLFVFAAAVFTAELGIAQKAKKSAASSEWTGYVVDKMCSKRMSDTRAPKHTKDCLLEERCAASGYGIYTGGKWTAFDAKGNGLAAEYLKNSSKTDNFHVVVKGTMKGSTIVVESINDAP